MPETTVGAIVVREQNETVEVLLTRRGHNPFKGRWCIPGGHIDENEPVEAAIVREVKEETGLDFAPQFFRCFDELLPQSPTHAVVMVFVGPGAGMLHAQDGEVSEMAWFPLDQARALNLAFSHNAVLDAYAAHRAETGSRAGQKGAMEGFTPEQFAYTLQFQHPEKEWEGLPGLNDTLLAALFGADVESYRRIRGAFAQRAGKAAAELLADPVFAAQVDRLPFAPGSTIVGLGDSITDDDQSWLEILRHLLALRRPQDGLRVVNAGVSGNTTAQMVSRFLDVVVEKPDWIICLAGTNDARRHGSSSEILVSIEETARNYEALRQFAATRTRAQWVWMTPPPVTEAQIEAHWFLSGFEMTWRNKDLAAIAAAVIEAARRWSEPVVDLFARFGRPANPAWLLPDGLHPSLDGQKVIVRALVEQLAGPPESAKDGLQWIWQRTTLPMLSG